MPAKEQLASSLLAQLLRFDGKDRYIAHLSTVSPGPLRLPASCLQLKTQGPPLVEMKAPWSQPVVVSGPFRKSRYLAMARTRMRPLLCSSSSVMAIGPASSFR